MRGGMTPTRILANAATLGAAQQNRGEGAHRPFTPARSTSASVAELRPALGKLRLEPGHDAGVHLADARLAQIQGGADLLHRHVLVIVEDDDEAFVAVQAAG